MKARNLVAKHSGKYCRAATHKCRKTSAKNGYVKHKRTWVNV